MSFSLPPFRAFNPFSPAAGAPSGAPAAMPDFDDPELDDGDIDSADDVDDADASDDDTPMA